LAVISSVNCSASVTRAIARHFDRQRLSAFPNVDGVVALTHHGGCAMQFNGQQHQILNRVLGGMARHPNIGGYVLIGLGCEKATLDFLIADQRLVQIEGLAGSSLDTRPPTLTMQTVGGTAKTIEAGIRLVEQLLPQVDQVQREPIPASELILATQCGGSDGSSGITANPAVGVACDLLVDQGGTAILGETTEIVGAEHLLTRRAVNEPVGRKLLEKIAWWKWYAGLFGETLDDNRSAGNAAGGLTTIAEKSLGAIAKAGSRPLVQVYEYAEPVAERGLVIMDSPGFDPASITGMVAGGANLVVFTTGRGSCYGCKPAPSLKIATNTPMFQRMQDDMDVDAGRVLAGATVEDLGREIFELLLDVASGRPTKSEAQGLGDEEFVPWMIGPIL
jgi:altronate hydrolase